MKLKLMHPLLPMLNFMSLMQLTTQLETHQNLKHKKHQNKNKKLIHKNQLFPHLRQELKL